MTKSKKKLGIAIFVLVVALVVATSSTFAWFTMNPEVQISNFDVNVTTGNEDLYVAVGDINSSYTEDLVFKTKIEGQEILDNIGAISMTALSPYTDQNLDLAVQGGDADVGYDPQAGGTGKETLTNQYVAFKLYFRTTAQGSIMDVLLDDNQAENGASVKSAGLSRIKGWADYAAGAFGMDDPSLALGINSNIDVDVANAIRVGFAPVNQKIQIWNPGLGKGFSSPVVGGAYPEGKLNMAEEFNKFMNPPADPDTYVPIIEKDNKTFMQSATVSVDGTDKTGRLTRVLQLKDVNGQYHTGEMTVKIWLEGTDGDCFNAIYNAVAKIRLKFRLPNNQEEVDAATGVVFAA